MASTANPKGVQLSKVSPAFLHANSTSHTWAFSAFAELIDNAYDPDVSASELLIDKMEINNNTCLIFLDNGAGMDSTHLLKMLSFGFCEKQMYERTMSHLPIGHYGNGFKSGSMRLGKDALVFTRCQTSASIGFLSQTYLKAIGADSVFIPIINYRLPKLDRVKSEQSRNNLEAILRHSVFKTEQDLKEELFALEGSKTGTKIILSHLKRLQDGTLELDFSSDETDIRCPEAHEVDLTSVYHRPIQYPTSEYKHSLKEYCSILFLRPRMKITIRGKRVKSKLISKSLFNTEIDSYKPTWLNNRPLKITFGFTCDKTKTDDYGMMLYHRNRLIKAFEKVGYQKQPNDLGIGVVGVAQVDFLQPTHNKQDFNKDEKFNSVMTAFASKLNDYWNEKKQNTPAPLLAVRTGPDWIWAQCEQCLKWRRLPDGVNVNTLAEQWFCRLNPDPTHNRCEIPEEPEDEDLAVKPSYVKTFKRKKEEQKRQELFDRQKQDMERQKMIREREMKQKEAELMAIRRGANTIHHRALPPETLELQRALADAKKRESESVIKMEMEKKQIEEQKKTLLQLAESLQQSKGKNPNVMDKVSQLIGSMTPESSRTPTKMPQKRKIDDEPADTPRYPKRQHIKEEVTEASSVPNNKPNNPKTPTPDRNNSNKKQNSASSQLRVKVSGIVHPDKQEQAKTSAKKVPSDQSKSSFKNMASITDDDVVDLTDDLDFEVTINEDYMSDEDVKPDVNELGTLQEKEKGKENQIEKDVKPDKSTLDRTKAEESKEKKAAVTDTLVNVKKEIQDKDSTPKRGTTTLNDPSTSNGPACATDANDETPPQETSNGPACAADSNDETPPQGISNGPACAADSNGETPPQGISNGPACAADSNDETPPQDTFSSNVEKVMAVIESKIKENNLKKKVEEVTLKKNKCSNGNETEKTISGGKDGKFSHDDVIIDSCQIKEDPSSTEATHNDDVIDDSCQIKEDPSSTEATHNDDVIDDSCQIKEDPSSTEATHNDDVIDDSCQIKEDPSSTEATHNDDDVVEINSDDDTAIEMTEVGDVLEKQFDNDIDKQNTSKSKGGNLDGSDEIGMIEMDDEEGEETSYRENVSDSVEASETMQKETSYGENVTDSVEASETMQKETSYGDNVSDSVQTNENIQKESDHDNVENALESPNLEQGSPGMKDILVGEYEMDSASNSLANENKDMDFSKDSKDKISNDDKIKDNAISNFDEQISVQNDDIAVNDDEDDYMEDNFSDGEVGDNEYWKESTDLEHIAVESNLSDGKSVDSPQSRGLPSETTNESHHLQQKRPLSHHLQQKRPLSHEQEEEKNSLANENNERVANENNERVADENNERVADENNERVADEDPSENQMEICDTEQSSSHSMNSVNDANEDQTIHVLPKSSEHQMDCSSSNEASDETTQDKHKHTNHTLRTSLSSDIILCDKESQTDSVLRDKEAEENLRSKLEVRTQLLEQGEQRLQSLLENVHHLLSFLSPGTDLGNVQDIEQTVKTMVHVHLEGSQEMSQSQETHEAS